MAVRKRRLPPVVTFWRACCAALTRLAAAGTTGSTCTRTSRPVWRSAARRAARARRRAWLHAACCSASAALGAGTRCTTAQSTTARCPAGSARKAPSATHARRTHAPPTRRSATASRSGHGPETLHSRRTPQHVTHRERTQLSTQAVQLQDYSSLFMNFRRANANQNLLGLSSSV